MNNDPGVITILVLPVVALFISWRGIKSDRRKAYAIWGMVISAVTATCLIASVYYFSNN